MAAYKLVLIRHGESAWNLENRFSGWYDADLSPAGHEEAKRGGQALRGAERAGEVGGSCEGPSGRGCVRAAWLPPTLASGLSRWALSLQPFMLQLRKCAQGSESTYSRSPSLPSVRGRAPEEDPCGLRNTAL